MHEHDIEAELADAMGSCLKEFIEGGAELPIRAVAIAANGYLVAAEYTVNEAGDGLDTEMVAERPVGAGLHTPINLVFVDSTGAAARMVIGSGGKRSPFSKLN